MIHATVILSGPGCTSGNRIGEVSKGGVAPSFLEQLLHALALARL